ncbi:MAG: hypothetical protein E6L04_06335 [Thaumarchaeota archaeon]|nr:MAG: hypothetical protein E6L04_06335 [Nitrososphaerota archaeon]TLX86604.1 MAG: hypothetical protein E6K97_10880 [Nitrososphaerota archaeon]
MVKSVRTKNPPLRQGSDESPVIENPSLEKMDKALDRPNRIRGKILRMPLDPPPPSRGRGKKVMNPIPIKTQEELDTTEGTSVEYPQQEEFKGTRKKPSRQKDESYLRLRLLIQDGNMSVVEAHKVNGPLTMENKIESSLVYEAVIPSKRIAMGSITDVGFNRSFPNPEGVPGQEGHLFIEVPSYEFYARLPVKDLSASILPKLEIAVYKVKSPIENTMGEKSLAADFGNELREVARLKGISIKTLSQRSQKEIRDVIR